MLNILYIHSHDSGRYLQPYGLPVQTPHIQKLAEEGVLFRQAFCAAPTCSPSRAALLTGQSPHSSGMLGLAHRGFRLNDYRQHLAQVLGAAGCHTTLIGTQHEARDPAMIGYHQILALDGGSARDVAPAAARFLREGPSQPFFLSVGFSETHREFPEPEPPFDGRYNRAPLPLPDQPEVRRDFAAYQTSARRLDEGVGEVLEALEASGLAGATLVISTTDHGLAFPGMKCNLTSHGTGVSLILRAPRHFAGGRVLDGLVSHIDLFPTLCELAGIARPAWLQGKSLMPLLRGEAREVNEEIFAEVTFHAAEEPQRGVRTQRYQYIRRFDDRQTPVLPNCDDSPSKEVWVKSGWATRPPQAEQLYDLVFDPNEACNLAGRPEMAGVLEEMRARLRRWMETTGDPLLQGRVRAPAGAQLNDPDRYSPSEPTFTVD